MGLERLELKGVPAKLPHHLQVLLDETSEDLADWQGGSETHMFVPADYVLVFDALSELRTLMPRGSRPSFMEWGSGLGIVTLIAQALGWNACGVEIQPDLVRQSLYLSRTFDLPATFLEGSFFPKDRQAVDKLVERIGAADLVYVYPWPDQEIELYDLFDRHAHDGALLLTYVGLEDVRAYRKQG